MPLLNSCLSIQVLLISIKWKCGVLVNSFKILLMGKTLFTFYTCCNKLVHHICLFSADLNWPNKNLQEFSGGELCHLGAIWFFFFSPFDKCVSP